MIKMPTKSLVWLCGFIIVVLPISHDPASAEQRFIDHGNGTVTDRKLGLMWSKTDNQTDILWNQIQGWLDKEFPDTIPKLYEDWRLPTISELQSLYVEDPKYEGYKTVCGYPVKVVPQIRLSCILIWTSDTALGLPLAFNFNIGSTFSVELHERKGCRVLPVRSLE